MEKIKVSREIATFIENYENNVAGVPGWEERLLAQHCEAWATGFDEVRPDVEAMKDISPLELSRILIYGYEVEETPEEILLRNYDVLTHSTPHERGIKDGIIFTLDTLKINVKGINA